MPITSSSCSKGSRGREHAEKDNIRANFANIFKGNPRTDSYFCLYLQVLFIIKKVGTEAWFL